MLLVAAYIGFALISWLVTSIFVTALRTWFRLQEGRHANPVWTSPAFCLAVIFFLGIPFYLIALYLRANGELWITVAITVLTVVLGLHTGMVVEKDLRG